MPKKAFWHPEKFISKLAISVSIQEDWFMISEKLFSIKFKAWVNVLEDRLHWELSASATCFLPDSRTALHLYSGLCISCLKLDVCRYLLSHVSLDKESRQNPAVSFYNDKRISCYEFSQNTSVRIMLTYSRSLSSYEWCVRSVSRAGAGEIVPAKV